MIVSVFDRAENIVGKGKNASYQHFLLFPQCCEKASFPDTSKGVIVWEWVKSKCLSDMRLLYEDIISFLHMSNDLSSSSSSFYVIISIITVIICQFRWSKSKTKM